MKFFIMTCLCLFGSLSFAANGGENGNGGNGVAKNGKIYSLDLFEAGAQVHPYFQEGLPADPRILKFIDKYLGRDYPILPISKKMTEIYEVNPHLAFDMLKTIKVYNWQLIDSRLINIPDDQDTVVNLPAGNLVQLAVRYRDDIKIDHGYWELMSPENKAALIFHEVLYALIRPQGLGTPKAHQDCLDVRRMVGYLFSTEFTKQPLNTFIMGLDTKGSYASSWLYNGLKSSQASIKNSADVDGHDVGDLFSQAKNDSSLMPIGADIFLKSGGIENWCKLASANNVNRIVWQKWKVRYATRPELPNGWANTQFEQDTSPLDSGYDSCVASLQGYVNVDPLDSIDE